MKYELEDFDLKNLAKLQKDIENTILVRKELLEKIKILIPTFILTKEFFKTIEIINKSTLYSINKMKKENFSEIYLRRLKLKEVDTEISQYMEIVKNLYASEAKSAKYLKTFIEKNEKNKENQKVE